MRMGNSPPPLEVCPCTVVSSRPVDTVSASQEQGAPVTALPDFPNRRASLILWVCLALYTIGLLTYSQTMAFVWDEGFHLLTAQLIDNGRTPYIDFCFPQTLLNAYWNAAWMHVFGQTWRVTHVAATLLVAGTVFLTTDFVFRRFPVPQWRFPCALAVAGLTGLNDVFIPFGPIAQSYAMGLFFSVAAFRLAVSTASRRSWLWAFAAGLCAGAAAGSTLLTAPVAPVILLWLFIYNRMGNRWHKALVFCSGCVIPFAHMLALFAKAPKQTFFNIVQYQAMFRRVNWNGATTHDIDALMAWLNSTPALLTGLLVLAGLFFLLKRSPWDRLRRAEIYLCAWLSGALILYIATAHPTFQRYFIVAVPFCAILATVGLYAVSLRLASPARPFWPTFLLSTLLVLSAAKLLFDDRDSTTWKHYEKIADKIREVTPPGANLYADEHVYFLLRRTPPPGMEFSYSHKLDLPPQQEALFHIVSERELNEQVKAGKFATVESCKDERIDEMHLPELFPHQADIGDCSVFWGKVKTNQTSTTRK